jgi:RNA polymerase sigma factor (sigma-70 family)
VTGFEPSVALLAAANGDQHAWDSIVEQYAGLVWSVARSFRLSRADAGDVCQATWLRLVEHLTEVRDGERLGAWLATTARREALGLLRRGRRDVATADVDLLGVIDIDPAPSPEDEVLRGERTSILWRSFARLGGSCQALLRLLFADPVPSYAEVSAALSMPIGSIGPARARCLTALHHMLPEDLLTRGSG